MLKLEKKSRNRGIHITVKENGGLFTRNFLYALAIAVGLHALGLLIFQITPFKLGHVQTLFPPVQVKIDYEPLIDQGVLAELEHKPEAHTVILEPKRGIPILHDLSRAPLAKSIVRSKISKVTDYPFEKMESAHVYQDPFSLSFSESLNAPLKVRISGAIADKPLLNNDWNEEYQRLNMRSKDGERQLAKFRIKVEDRTGRVIWFESKASFSKRKPREFSEKIVAGLAFAPQPNGFISEGEVEMELTL